MTWPRLQDSRNHLSQDSNAGLADSKTFHTTAAFHRLQPSVYYLHDFCQMLSNNNLWSHGFWSVTIFFLQHTYTHKLLKLKTVIHAPPKIISIPQISGACSIWEILVWLYIGAGNCILLVWNYHQLFVSLDKFLSLSRIQFPYMYNDRLGVNHLGTLAGLPCVLGQR